MFGEQNAVPMVHSTECQVPRRFALRGRFSPLLYTARSITHKALRGVSCTRRFAEYHVQGASRRRRLPPPATLAQNADEADREVYEFALGAN